MNPGGVDRRTAEHMRFQPTPIPGCFEIPLPTCRDARGTFVKTFQSDRFAESHLATRFAEEYYTVSHRGVLRGLHFQVPPRDHDKIVYCLSGEVMDAIVDLRRGSPGYGRHHVFRLSGENPALVYIPRGVAHGFYVLSDQAIMAYKVTSAYSPEHDKGILWNSAGIPWPDRAPLLSERDMRFSPLGEFRTPFIFPGISPG